MKIRNNRLSAQSTDLIQIYVNLNLTCQCGNRAARQTDVSFNDRTNSLLQFDLCCDDVQKTQRTPKVKVTLCFTKSLPLCRLWRTRLNLR